MAPSTAGGGQSRWAALGAIAVLVITCGAYMGGSGAGATAKFEAARFDDETGAPLNDAAMNLLVAAEADGSRSSIAPEASIRALDSVPSVHIEPGTWKFVTIDVFVPADPTHSKSVVRNYAGLKYHAEMYQRAMEGLRSLGLAARVLGGGRLVYDPAGKRLSVYGYSKTFGRAPGNNEVTAGILQRQFPGFVVEWSDEGY